MSEVNIDAALVKQGGLPENGREVGGNAKWLYLLHAQRGFTD